MIKPVMIVDTNVVLNRWFFNDAATIVLLNHLSNTHHWVGTHWMLAETLRVAAAPHLNTYRKANLNELERHYRAAVTMVELPADVRSPMRCRDTDDQTFLDLAHHKQATLLLTLDRDLLKLRKRAASFGLHIVQPAKLSLPITMTS